MLNIENFNDRSYVGKIGREAWGFIEYEKPISSVLLHDFELVAASDEDGKYRIRVQEQYNKSPMISG